MGAVREQGCLACSSESRQCSTQPGHL
jgi:hypothetical protein